MWPRREEGKRILSDRYRSDLGKRFSDHDLRKHCRSGWLKRTLDQSLPWHFLHGDMSFLISFSFDVNQCRRSTSAIILCFLCISLIAMLGNLLPLVVKVLSHILTDVMAKMKRRVLIFVRWYFRNGRPKIPPHFQIPDVRKKTMNTLQRYLHLKRKIDYYGLMNRKYRHAETLTEFQISLFPVCVCVCVFSLCRLSSEYLHRQSTKECR